MTIEDKLKPPRKVIQVAVWGGMMDHPFALCNDGSMWRLSEEHSWLQLPPIPQDGDDDSPPPLRAA